MKTDGSNAVATTSNAKSGTLGDWMAGNRAAFISALPKNTLNVDRFIQSAIMAITNPKNPLLKTCTKDSLFRALKESAAYGLEVSGILGQAYLIPYNESVQVAPGKWEKQMTAHFQCGYKGLIELARRSNTIKTIAAEPIHANDIVDIELGMNRHLSHKIDITKERGEIIAYYCLVELTNGGCQFHIMSKKDAENHRDKFSKAYKKEDKDNIWNKNFDAMALKSCVIQALKLCPISIEALDAVSKEEMADVKDTVVSESDYSVTDDTKDVVDAEIVEPAKIEQPVKPEPKAEPSNFNQNIISQEEEDLAAQAFDAQQTFETGDIF